MIFCDSKFCVNFGHFPLFSVTNFVLGGSQEDDFLLELEYCFRAGQISAGAERLTYLSNKQVSRLPNKKIDRFSRVSDKFKSQNQIQNILIGLQLSDRQSPHETGYFESEKKMLSFSYILLIFTLL